MAPAFEKLRNPVVRRTEARIAVLAQAAAIGGVDLQRMVLKLHTAAGVDGLTNWSCGSSSMPVATRRTYLVAGRVVEEVDADAMLECGIHPIGKIREAVSAEVRRDRHCCAALSCHNRSSRPCDAQEQPYTARRLPKST